MAGELEEVRARRVKGYPLGRFERPDEVAQSVLFLSSGMSSLIREVVLVVDGGFSSLWVWAEPSTVAFKKATLAIPVIWVLRIIERPD